MDIGGGAAEAAVISLGGVVVHFSARVGGNKLDEAIANHIKKHHNLIIGDQTAEWVKIKIGDALSENSENSDSRNVRKSDSQIVGDSGSPSIPSILNFLDVKGRDAISGLPWTVTVSSKDVTEAIHPRLMQIISAIKSVLEQVPLRNCLRILLTVGS